MDNCETWGEEIDDIGGTDRDAARVRLGGAWRLPTLAECNELIDNCDYEWTAQNRAWGGKFTGRKKGESIFLPATGERYARSLVNSTISGNYWSSTSCSNGRCRAKW